MEFATQPASGPKVTDMRRQGMLLSLLVLVASLSLSLATFSGNTTASGTTIAGGLFHTCMIVSDLSLRCFGGGSSEAVAHIAPTGSIEDGFGNYGQIGSGDNETLGDEEGEMGYALAAVDLGINTAQDVTAGQSHTCVILTSGDIACFGYNFYGQLGLGVISARGLSPSDMGEDLAMINLGTNRTATRIGSGHHHSCAVLDDGSLKCWGKNDRGMLGLGDTLNRGNSIGEMGDDLPPVDLGRTAVSASGGRYHTCALLDNETLKCWGGNNSTGMNYGQLGQGNTLDVGSSAGQMGDALPAIDLGANRKVVAFDLGWYHTCALLDDGSLKCFGRNFDGQLGLGDTKDRGDEPGEMGDDLPAVDLGTGRYTVAITCGRWHTCALLDNGDVKCFGANTSDDLGAGQLGLEDSENRGQTVDTTGDGLKSVQLGIGRTSGWIFAAFDHTCVIFDDAMSKCWGLNTSGQLGLGNTNDVGADEGTMGEALPAVQPGLRLAFPPSPAIFDKCSVSSDPPCTSSEASSSTTSSARSSTASPAPGSLTLAPSVARYSSISSPPVTKGASPNHPKWTMFLATVASALGLVVCCMLIACCRLRHKRQAHSRNVSTAPSTFASVDETQYERYPTGMGGTANPTAIRMSNIVPGEMAPDATGMAAVGATGVVIASAYYGWDVVNRVAETLPWIGAAFFLLNDLVDIVDTKFELEGNFKRIRGWALCLRDVILQISRQIEIRQSDNAQSLRYMSMDVISSLEELVATATEWEKKGMLAQYVASRSCKRAVDAADAALRGALQRLTVGQAAELMTMVSGLENARLVVTEKLDMVFEQLRRQEETTARLELRLAQYSEAMAETLHELGKETLDRLQIPKEDIKYASSVPFATGAFSEVYQVIHEGVVKAAKKTNLRRLGLRAEGTDRVFGRFVKELYILSRMRSDRVVSVYGAVATPTELTLVMEFVERGSLRSILDDDAQREQMTPAVKHELLADTAEGMKYLYDAGVEHRDLKSANCLITHDWRAKAPELLIAGLGLIQEVPAELSDVYSFGVIVWDVLCGNGELPWAHLNATQLLLKLRRGEHLSIAAECSHFYRTLMKNCWSQYPQRRPRFELILSTLKKKTFKTEEASPLAMLPSGATIQETRGSTCDLHDSAGERHRIPFGQQVGLVDAFCSSAGQSSTPLTYADCHESPRDIRDGDSDAQK